jgi:CRP/FNR family transcriptional regulator
MRTYTFSKEIEFHIDSILRTIPFFACLSDEEYVRLKQIVKTKLFFKNQVILLEEQTSNFMYIVYSGKVKAVKISKDGREKILAIHEKGDFFGEMALLDGKTSPATVIAMEKTIVGLISKDDFESCLLKNGNIQKEIISLLCTRLREAWLMLKILSFADAENRIRAILGHLGSHFGQENQRGTIIRIRLTHQDIAHYASVSRETVTRALDRLSQTGEVEMLGQGMILLKPIFLEKIPFL